jgi:hypothetical protein
MAQEEFEVLLDQLNTVEGKIHFLRPFIEKGNPKACSAGHTLVSQYASTRAQQYANGNPVFQAAKMYEELGMLSDAMNKYTESGQYSNAAGLAKKLSLHDRAKDLFLEHVKRQRQLDGVSSDYLIGLAGQARDYGLSREADELIIQVVRREMKSNPTYAHGIAEKNLVGEYPEIMKELYARLAIEAEKGGNFLAAARWSSKAGQEDKAQFYEKISASATKSQ